MGPFLGGLSLEMVHSSDNCWEVSVLRESSNFTQKIHFLMLRESTDFSVKDTCSRQTNIL